MEKQRVNIYIDGFNFYFGLRAFNWRRFYWLDIVKFFSTFIKPHQTLQNVFYYSAIPINDKGKIKRQERFFTVNKENSLFQLVLGKYFEKNIHCNRCGNIIKSWEEKQTDVNIAVNLLQDAITNTCDVSILVSGDSDIVPAIKAIKSIKPTHKIFVFFPPQRNSYDLRNYADSFLYLEKYTSRFKSSMFSPIVSLSNGRHIQKPQKWD